MGAWGACGASCAPRTREAVGQTRILPYRSFPKFGVLFYRLSMRDLITLGYMLGARDFGKLAVCMYICTLSLRVQEPKCEVSTENQNYDSSHGDLRYPLLLTFRMWLQIRVSMQRWGVPSLSVPVTSSQPHGVCRMGPK